MNRITCHLALLAACAGCGTLPLLDSQPTTVHSPSYSLRIFDEGNYLTFDHAFTDAAAEAARKSAERHCAGRKQVAVKTSGACSLTRCTTHYHCMKPADAAAYQLQDAKMKK